MAIKVVGSASGVEANVSADGALWIETRPAAVGALGAYSIALVSGSIAAPLAAGSTLFSMRWTDATRLCLVRSVRVSAIVNGTITTAVNFDVEAIVVRGFSASDSGGTAAVFTGNNNKMRTSFGSSLMGDMRISSTGALAVGTRTVDAQAEGRLQGTTGTVIGTQIFGSGQGPIYIIDREPPGQYPLVLATNEGLLIRNPLVGPATGTFQLLVVVEWQEVASY